MKNGPLTAALAICLVLAFLNPPLLAVSDAELRAIEFTQYPGRELPLELRFRDTRGASVRLGDLFQADPPLPVILVPGYFRCEMLCTGVSDGLQRALQGSRKTVGRDFRVIHVSIDPRETLEQAGSRKRIWLKRYGRAGIESGCEFLSGGEGAIAELARRIGFGYRFDPATGEFAHPAGFLVVRPDGKIFRYFFGVSFSAAELEEALDAAARDGRPSLVKRLLLLCFHYDPVRSPYGSLVMQSLRFLAFGTVAGVVLLAVRFKRPPDRRADPPAKENSP